FLDRPAMPRFGNLLPFQPSPGGLLYGGDLSRRNILAMPNRRAFFVQLLPRLFHSVERLTVSDSVRVPEIYLIATARQLVYAIRFLLVHSRFPPFFEFLRYSLTSRRMILLADVFSSTAFTRSLVHKSSSMTIVLTTPPPFFFVTIIELYNSVKKLFQEERGKESVFFLLTIENFGEIEADVTAYMVSGDFMLSALFIDPGYGDF